MFVVVDGLLAISLYCSSVWVLVVLMKKLWSVSIPVLFLVLVMAAVVVEGVDCGAVVGVWQHQRLVNG
ncbi:hypothetical protein [Acinetobacter baumannii]|uniref:hypothetical protein n=1 Tax=Acinetobacter baumannii TaxID=470 RepID=UPI00235F57E0|nr:hypothetical protein [Acinetobacter baumannii]WDC50556.1 hypothetical protein PTC93_19345 [Acinetobacter baumannii]